MPIIIAIIISVVAVVTVGAAAIAIYVVQKNLKSIKTIKDTIQNQVNTIGKSRTVNDELSTHASIYINEPDLRRNLSRYHTYLLDDVSKANIWSPLLFSHKTKSIEAPTKPEKIIEEKKQSFLSVPVISFHFANDEEIKDFYNEYFKEPTVESLVSEITGEVSGEIKGSLPQIIESRIGSSNLSKWISTIKLPDDSLNSMFLRFQRETIKNNQVTLGIEEVDIELTELNTFDELVEDLESSFGFSIDEAVLNSQRAKLREKAAEKTLSKLEHATGWVLVEGKFKIEDSVDFYKCTYTHPVNRYLSNQACPVTISVLIPRTSLKEHIKGNYAQSIGKSIPLKIYGQVWQPIDRKANTWDLQLTPLAIY